MGTVRVCRKPHLALIFRSHGCTEHACSESATELIFWSVECYKSANWNTLVLKVQQNSFSDRLNVINQPVENVSYCLSQSIARVTALTLTDQRHIWRVSRLRILLAKLMPTKRCCVFSFRTLIECDSASLFDFFFFFNSNLGMPWMRGLKPHVLPSCTTAFPRDNQALTKSNQQTQSGRWKIAGLFTCTIFRRVWPRWFLDKKEKKKNPQKRLKLVNERCIYQCVRWPDGY